MTRFKEFENSFRRIPAFIQLKFPGVLILSPHAYLEPEIAELLIFFVEILVLWALAVDNVENIVINQKLLAFCRPNIPNKQIRLCFRVTVNRISILELK